MKVLIVGLIVLALGVAGVSTYLIKSFSSKDAIEELEKEAEPVKIRVLVAARALTAGEKIAAGDMKWQEWPQEILSPQYIVVEKDDEQEKRAKKLTGSITRSAIQEGEPILQAKLFKRDKAGFMAGMLSPGMRAISLQVTVKSGVAGFILPNDRVDVLLVHDKIGEIVKKQKKAQEKADKAAAKKKRIARLQQPDQPDPDGQPETEAEKIVQPNPAKDLTNEAPMWFLRKNLGPYIFISRATETILRNIRVIAIDQTVGQPEGNALPAKTVTLELTPAQTELITEAQSMGKISLSLRALGPEVVENESLTSTTDVNVSPLLGAFYKDFVEVNEKLMKMRKAEKKKAEHEERLRKQTMLEENAAMRRKAAELEALRQRQAHEIETLRRQGIQSMVPIKPTAPIATNPVTAKPVAKKAKKSSVKIYRGGAANLEEIPIK